MGFLDSIGEQVDTTVDETAGGIEDVTGVSAWKETETAENLDEQVAEGGFLDRVDAGAKALVDVTLDNPNASLQEGVQTGMVEAYQAGSGDETATDEDVAGAWKDAISDTSQNVENQVEGTALDNPATDAAVWVGEAVVAEPAEAVFGGLTGVDVAEGDTEATVGAMDLFDIGVGAATAGTGTVAARAVSKGATEGAPLLGRLAARGSDEAAQVGDEAVQVADESGGLTRALGRSSDGTPALPAPDETVKVGDDAAQTAEESGGFVATILGGGDEAAQAGSKAGDETAQVADVRANRPFASIFDETAQTADESGGFMSRVLGRGGDEAAQAGSKAGDEVAQTADESGGFMSRVLGRGGDEAAQVGDDAADDAAEEGGGFLSRVLGRGGDDAAKVGDDAADDVAEESGGLISRLIPNSTTGKVALGGGGAFLAGGAATTALSPEDAPDEFETEDGLSFSKTGSLDPTDEFPNGGALYNVQRDYKSKGYWVYLGSRGRNLILLDEDRNTRTAKISVSDFKAKQPGGSA